MFAAAVLPTSFDCQCSYRLPNYINALSIYLRRPIPPSVYASSKLCWQEQEEVMVEIIVLFSVEKFEEMKPNERRPDGSQFPPFFRRTRDYVQILLLIREYQDQALQAFNLHS